MIIYNTTYHAGVNVEDKFIKWLRTEYIPRALASGELSLPQLTCVMSDRREVEGKSFALQFHAPSIEVLEIWYRRTGATLLAEMRKIFNEDVVGFSALMEKLELE